MMSKLRTLLGARKITGATPQEGLAQIRAEIAEHEDAIPRLDKERQAKALEAVTGDRAASDRLEAIDEETAERRRRITDLRAAAAEIEQRERADKQAEAEAAIAARPGRLAELREKSLDLDDEIERSGNHTADLIRAKRAIDDEIAAVADNLQLRRTTEVSRQMIRDALALCFQIDKGRGNNDPGNNFLGLKCGLLGAEITVSLRERDGRRFDDVVPYYTTEADAWEAQGRLEARGQKTTVAKLTSGRWVLIRRDDLYATQAQAEAEVQRRREMARRIEGPGLRVTWVPFGRVFALVDPHFVSGLVPSAKKEAA